ncbi:uncharacterized protein LOC130965749 [Arachis stenosperma]|uniref:uncharacterized protein LOC130965749 n=1 Tax=Arachis stenosperma TaxID=217475 RepID=UPI0025AB64D9|nr:uncharacterized protein LOC130965749 [Arachis stenosperma]
MDGHLELSKEDEDQFVGEEVEKEEQKVPVSSESAMKDEEHEPRIPCPQRLIEESREVPNSEGQDKQTIRRLRREVRGKNTIGEEVSTEEEHHDMKPPLITLIKNNCSYGRNPLEDPKQHISTFLKSCGAIKPDGIDHDTYKLLLFPFSLRGEAAQWLETFPQRSITSWDDLVTKFLAKFSSSQQIIKLKEGVHPFTQGEEEPLFKAWERYKKANDKRISDLETMIKKLMEVQVHETKNHMDAYKKLEEHILLLAHHFSKTTKKGEIPFNITENRPNNNENATKREEWKKIIEESKKILDKESTSQEKHNKEVLQGETEDRIREDQKIPTKKFSLGDKVLLNIQTMKVSPQLSDHYIVTKILPRKFIEVIKENTGRKFTVKKDKLRHYALQFP